ncbi:MAG TPA: APC family permease [Caulobacteraceae bacterium]|jgi:amino acid transporter
MTDQQQAPFKRSMHAFGALMITLSALSPTIGVFVVGSDILHEAGTAVFPCYVLAVIVGIAIVNVYGELGTAYPDTGGEYTILGRVLSPAWGFAVLGINILGFTIANALTGLGMAKYLGVLIPGLDPRLTAMTLVAIVTAMAMLNIRVNAWITGVFLACELLGLVLIAGLGFTHIHRSFADAALSMSMLDAHGSLVPASPAIIGVAGVAALYAFNGYGSVVFLGEEIHEAPKRIARVALWALALGAVTELIPMLAVLIGAPDLKAVIGAKDPIAAFALATGGPVMAKVVSLAVAVAIFNCMIVVALLSGRMIYATARDGCWPAAVNRALTKIHPRFNSPWAATLLVGVCSGLCCVVPLKLIEVIVASGVAALYGALCIGAIWGRRNGKTAHAAYRMPLGLFFPVAGLIALAGVVIATWFDPHNGRIGLLATIIAIAFYVAYYWLFLRKSGWAHRGPGME